MDVDPIKVDQKTVLSITTMETKKTIVGDIFIIPNSLAKPKNMMFEEARFDLYRMAKANDIKFTDESKFVEVWFATPGNQDSNWRDHTIDGYDELKGWRPIWNYLPVELFKGRKEGDVVTFNLPIESWTAAHPITGLDNSPAGCNIPNGVTVTTKIKVSMTLAQTKYRYRRFGTFEEVLEKLGA